MKECCRRVENFFLFFTPLPSSKNTHLTSRFSKLPSRLFRKSYISFCHYYHTLSTNRHHNLLSSPTLKWQSLVMIYGANFILFLFFFSSWIALVADPLSIPNQVYIYVWVCMSCNLCCFHASLNISGCTAEHPSIVNLYIHIYTYIHTEL